MKDEKKLLAYDVEAAAEKTCLSRAFLYRAIATGSLISFKAGRRRLISEKALQEYLERLQDKSRVAA